MADFQGKRPFLWAQHSQLCALDPTDISALGNWPLGIGQRNVAIQPDPTRLSAPVCVHLRRELEAGREKQS